MRTTFLLSIALRGLGLSATTAALPQAPSAHDVRNSVPPTPLPEAIDLVRLQLPPGVPNDTVGACNAQVNPHGTGCLLVPTRAQFRSGDWLPDGRHVTVQVVFAGAPAAPDPASIYNGTQIIILKTDNSTFPGGSKWKCITCGVPKANIFDFVDNWEYPQSFDDGKRILFGPNIASCGEHMLASDECTPDKTYIYGINWTTQPSASESGGIRELRIHPDNVHLGFNAFALGGTSLGQWAYFGRLVFNPTPATGSPRYDLINVYRLYRPSLPMPLSAEGSQLSINTSAISVGEFRGFSGRGDEVVYIGNSVESCNVDVFACHLQTGAVRRLTSHPEYIDPLDASPDGKWWAILDTRSTDRQMFLAGMRYVPPVIDQIVSTVVSSTRNNGMRRFFTPWLIDNTGDRGDYFGQKINGPGFSELGSGDLRDPQWNAQADPRWSPDSRQLLYWEAQTISPACGAPNPLPCFASKEEYGHDVRVIIATFTDREPAAYVPVPVVPDEVPWGELVQSGAAVPPRVGVPAGSYTLQGRKAGYADVVIGAADNDTKSDMVAVTYHNYSDDGEYFLDGRENVTRYRPSLTLSHLDWFSDLVQVGKGQRNTKKTSPDGFHITIDVMVNLFDANGTISSTVDGVTYKQPLNGA